MTARTVSSSSYIELSHEGLFGLLSGPGLSARPRAAALRGPGLFVPPETTHTRPVVFRVVLNRRRPMKGEL